MKGLACSIAVLFGGSGVLLLLGSVIAAIDVIYSDILGKEVASGFSGFPSVILGGLGVTCISAARHWFKESKQTAPVALLTKSSAKFLPEVETLVRGSDRPATAEQAELLRAAGQGAETPAEQLLRAVRGEGQDV